MRIRAWSWRLMVLAVAGSTAACATTGGAPVAGTQAASTAPSTSLAAPVDRVRAALERTTAGTGHFVHRDTTKHYVERDGTSFKYTEDVVQTAEGDFDGASGAAEFEVAFSATTPELQRQIPAQRLRIRRVAGKAYLTSPDWPPAMLGRWLVMNERPNCDAERIPTLVPLLGMLAAAERDVRVLGGGPEGKDYDVPVPVSTVIRGLNAPLRRSLQEAGLDFAALAGRARMYVTVNPDGLIASTWLANGDLLLQQAASQIRDGGMLHRLQTTRIDSKVEITEHGKPVTIQAPTPDQLIDPSEIQGQPPTFERDACLGTAV